jgi:hypothetical protein
MPMDLRNRATRLALGFGLFYALSVFIGATAAGGSTWGTGVGYALVFGPFFVLISYPLILALQAGLVYVVRRLARCTTREPALWGYVPVFLLSLLFLSAAAVGPGSPEAHFRRLVAADIPESVSGIEYWYRRGFGNSQWALRFQIAPADFDAVLARHPYKEREIEESRQPWMSEEFESKQTVPLVYQYFYSEPGPGGGLNINIYTDATRSNVVLLGSYD